MTLRAPSLVRPIRLVRQLELADCGAACLTMVLRAAGQPAELSHLRDLTSTGRDGVSAAGLVAAARSVGFDGQGIRCSAEHLPELPRGSVLHWKRNHFVVLDRVTRRGVVIVDPALGRRLVSWDTARRDYSGVALLFRADSSASPGTVAVPAQSPRSRRSLYRPFVTGTRRIAVATVACAVAVQGFALVHPFVLRDVVDRLSAGRASTDVARGLAFGVAALALGYLAATAGRLLFLVALQRTVDFRLTIGVLAHLVSLPYAFLARRSSGDLALRLRSTMVVRQILTSGALSAVLDGALVLLYLILIASIDAWFALLTVGAIGVQGGIVAFAWPRLRLSSAEALEAQTASQGQLLEIIGGLEVLKVSGTADRAVEAWSQRLATEVDAQAARGRLGGIVDGVLLTVRFAAPPALLALGLGRVSSGAIDLGDMLALAALAAAVTVPTAGLLGTVCTLSTVASYLERLDDLLRSVPEQRGTRRTGDAFSGPLRLEGVTYTYSALLPPAVRDVTLEIAPGEHVAIVGASGSGKTTLSMLIAGLYEPTQGWISLAGVDIRDYDVEQLRQQLGVVTQSTMLFSLSIRDNIAFGHEHATDEGVVRAARLAAIHDDIAALPSGYDTVLGNVGSGLSGGQRQRLALARALVGNPALLVLDEATSALDARTETAVHQGLRAMKCTSIVVAHRLSTVRKADRVVVLHDGTVVANGSYAKVRASSPEFRSLIEADLATTPRKASATSRKAAAKKPAAATRATAQKKR